MTSYPSMSSAHLVSERLQLSMVAARSTHLCIEIRVVRYSRNIAWRRAAYEVNRSAHGREIMTKRRSLHIGVSVVDPDQYGGWDGALAGCVNDANAMQEVAVSRGF